MNMFGFLSLILASGHLIVTVGWNLIEKNQEEHSANKLKKMHMSTVT